MKNERSGVGTKVNINLLFLKATLFSLILLPSFAFIPGLPSLRCDDILLLVWLIIALSQGKVYLPGLATRRFYLLLAIVFLFPISMLNGLLSGYETSFGDFNQYVRYIKYAAMYLLAAVVWEQLDDNSTQKILGFVILCGMALFLISASQYFDVFGLNKHYVHLVAPTQYITLVNNYPTPRPVGMIGNPNELAFIFGLLFFLAFFSVKFYRSKKYYLAVGVFLFGVLMTMSRGTLLAMTAGFLSFVFVDLLYQKTFGKAKVLLSAVVLVMLFYLVAMIPAVYDAFTWRFTKIFDLANDASTQVRFDNWSENIEIIKLHSFLGVGPLRRAEFEHAADNEWLLIWRSYGIIGVCLFVAFFSSSLFKRMLAPFKLLFIALVCAIFVYMIPLAIFHSLVLFPLVLFLFTFIDIRGRVDKVSP